MSKQSTSKRVGGEKRGNGTVSKSQVTPQMADKAAAVGGKSARAAQLPEKRAVGSSGGGGGSRSGSQTRPRTRAMTPPKKSGMAIRPLDLGLVALGLVVVMLIVWSTLGNKSSPAQQPATSDPNRPNPLKIGMVAPDFGLPSPDGKTYSLSQYKGKVVLLELFAPWCPHCQADAPIFNEVSEKYKEKGVQVLAVSASPWGRTLEEDREAQRDPTPISMDDVTWFRDTYKVTFPILFDKDVKVSEAYGLAFYPTVYLIDKEGKIAAQPAGNFVWENDKPVSQREEDLSVDFLSRELDKLLK